MKILKGTFFQRTLNQNEFAMIGFVTLDHPVKDEELYHLYNNSISHTPDNTYKQFLKFRLENFSFVRITQKENYFDKEKALSNLVKSLI